MAAKVAKKEDIQADIDQYLKYSIFKPTNSYVYKFVSSCLKNYPKEKWDDVLIRMLQQVQYLRAVEAVVGKHPFTKPNKPEMVMETLRYFFVHEMMGPAQMKEKANKDWVKTQIDKIAKATGKSSDFVQAYLTEIEPKIRPTMYAQAQAFVQNWIKKEEGKGKQARFGGFGDYVDYDGYAGYDYYDGYDRVGDANDYYYDYAYDDNDGQFAAYNDGDYYEDYYYDDIGGLNDFHRFGKRDRHLYGYGYRARRKLQEGINQNNVVLESLSVILLVLFLCILATIGIIFIYYRRRLNKLTVIQPRNNEENCV